MRAYSQGLVVISALSSFSYLHTLISIGFTLPKIRQDCYGNVVELLDTAFKYFVSRCVFGGALDLALDFFCNCFWTLPQKGTQFRKIASSLVWQFSSCKINYPLTFTTRCCKGQGSWVGETLHHVDLKVILSQDIFLFSKLSYSPGYLQTELFKTMFAFQACLSF